MENEMTTVKEFKDLGVHFVGGDSCKSVAYENVVNKTCNKIFFLYACNGCEVTSFAWRPLNTLPDNPKFKYEIGGHMQQWRPLLDQSAVKPSDDKLVFTQAMADSGVIPQVGELVQIRRFLSGDNEFYNGKVVASNLNTVWFCCDKYGDRLYHKAEVEFRVLDTRTPKQKAIDEMYYGWMNFKNGKDEQVDSVQYELCEYLYDQCYADGSTFNDSYALKC